MGNNTPAWLSEQNWQSCDPTNSTSPTPPARSGHGHIVFRGSVYILGGFDASNGARNDIWRLQNPYDQNTVRISMYACMCICMYACVLQNPCDLIAVCIPPCVCMYACMHECCRARMFGMRCVLSMYACIHMRYIEATRSLARSAVRIPHVCMLCIFMYACMEAAKY
jgi:hypothetical protein